MLPPPVRFQFNTLFTGRNGTYHAIALQLDRYDHRNVICMCPITTKGRLARCDIEVPIADIPELIKALQEMIA